MENVKGFKVFNPDWTCRGFQYEVGKVYEKDVRPSVCNIGFHFCKQAKDCFNYYRFDPNNKVAEVVALGDVAEDGDKCSTNRIEVVREVTWEEVLTIVNTGKACTGLCNSGDWNSGDRNSGDWNSGNRNSGNRNSGNSNSGDRNSGDWNSGDRNSGNRNSGDWNRASNVVGCFNTKNQKLRFFDEETDLTFEQWRNSEAYWLMNRIDFRPADWIWSDEMSDAEKAEHPEHGTTGGYLKIRDNTDCCKEWWNGLSQGEKQIIMSLPNFDADKFFIITGVNVG